MIRPNLGIMNWGSAPRVPVTVMPPIRSIASPGTTQPTPVTVASITRDVIEPIGMPVENVISPPTEVSVSTAGGTTSAAAQTSIGTPSGTIIPGVPDEYTYIGGGIFLFLLFSSMKHKR